MNLTDLTEVKSVLDIDQADTSEDVKLGLLIESASSWLQELLNRDFAKRSRTEFYGGSGTMELVLRQRPVFLNPLPVVREDDTDLGFFGSVPGSFDDTTLLVYGDDFCLKLDTDSTGAGVYDSSRCGILVRVNQLWDKPTYRQVGLLSPFIDRANGNVKVTYTAGYTVDTLPAQIRLACNILVGKMRAFLPVGSLLTSESYEERSVGYLVPNKRILLAEVWPLVHSFRNHYFGGSV